MATDHQHQAMTAGSGRRRRRGVSLIEALVALLVMSIGMLALVGVQSTLRINNDQSRQRAEAARLAAEDLERLRRFTSLDPVSPADPNGSYADIAALPATSASMADSTTTFTIRRNITRLPSPPRTVVQILVTWQDRENNTQTYTLDSVIAGVEPTLASLVMRPAGTPAFSQRNARHVTIPPQAKDLGSTSAFKPPNSGGVAWVFNNSTGAITSVCTGITTAQADITAADLTTCTTVQGLLVAGTVRFNFRGGPVLLPSPNPDNLSVFKPVANGTALWVFDDTARRLIKVCTGISAAVSAVTVADVANCPTVSTGDTSPYRCPYSSGPYASCDSDSAPLSALDSENPRWPALNLDIAVDGSAAGGMPGALRPTTLSATDDLQCFDDAPESAAAAALRTHVDYFCLVRTVGTGWGGRLILVPGRFSDAGTESWAADHKVCRYTADLPSQGDPQAAFTLNKDHPYTYCIETPTTQQVCPSTRVTSNLINQNYLVIAGNKDCPGDSPVNAASGNLVNSNTRQHQPAP